MISVRFVIPELKIDLELFAVETSKIDNEEVRQAVIGEVYYNDMELDFGGLKDG